jgi:hypothetical protein
MLKSVAVLHNSRKCSKKKNNDLTIASKIMLRSIFNQKSEDLHSLKGIKHG